MTKPKKVLFLTLYVFGATGGIEKVCRVAAKALFERTLDERMKVKLMSMHDSQEQGDSNRYFPTESFFAFNKKKLSFIAQAVREGRRSDLVILSHINLLLVGWLIKKISPKTKIILFAHGIEVWIEQSRRRKMMFGCCDHICSVSHFTARVVEEFPRIGKSRSSVLNNCLDPFLPQKTRGIQKEQLRKFYGFSDTDQVMFTLTRLSSRERYKGYDKVLEAMVNLKSKYPNLMYLVAGSYDEKEKKFLDDQIARLGLTNNVKFAGFIPDETLIDHFSMADLYVMPSMKEGFGIVFIEAMFYGLPVIAGNRDGSVDALKNGDLGLLVDPLDVHAIERAIEKVLTNREAHIPNRSLLMESFGFDAYKRKFKLLLDSV
ncbi:MAG: glycosyltransferase family 4 protein [Chitinophagaceae bacterium]|nr:glycosyltransferase family 4 protein [Bacteroidota bacterium]MCC6256848.1 glycosyltransferase family 4 protein [Chitinophagaceae bacterium]MCW5918033.1 glycosyltransferase family 4 protein [Ferruginibacter sp.]